MNLICRCEVPTDPTMPSVDAVFSAPHLPVHGCVQCGMLIPRVHPQLPLRLTHERLRALGVTDWRVSANAGTIIVQLRTHDRALAGMGSGVAEALNDAMGKLK